MAYFSSNQDLYKKNFTHILSNYMEPSLIASLVFEDNNKIKMYETNNKINKPDISEFYFNFKNKLFTVIQIKKIKNILIFIY